MANQTTDLPKGLEEHQAKYREGAWQEYSIAELGWWVHLFVKRSKHRTDPEKKKKDLDDAQNYLNVIQFRLDEAKRA